MVLHTPMGEISCAACGDGGRGCHNSDMTTVEGEKALAEAVGLVSTEVALLVPVVLLGFVLLITAGGRIVQAESDVKSAAQEAARAATFHDSVGAAAAEASAVAAANLATSGLSCVLGSDVTLDVQAPVGSSASGSATVLLPDSIVSVTVTCTADLSDVVALGLPGSRTFEAEAFERVDVHRSTP